VIAVVVGSAIGTLTITLVSLIVMLVWMLVSVIVSEIAGDIAFPILFHLGIGLLAVPGAFCVALSARLTQALCKQWNADVFATRVAGSSDRLVALGWAVGLLLGLVANLSLDRLIVLGVSSFGGTLLAAGLGLWRRYRDDSE